MGKAWEVIETARQNSPYYRYNTNLEIAHALEEHLPRPIINFYLEYVESLIAGRGRSNYVEAVEYLKKVRHLNKRLGLEEEWKQTIQALRGNNKKLRALKEELDRAGLE